MEKAKKYKTITVTVKQTYCVPVSDDESDCTDINGWTMKEVVDDWFKNHNINDYHATRRGHHMAGADEIICWQISKKAKTAKELGVLVR